MKKKEVSIGFDPKDLETLEKYSFDTIDTKYKKKNEEFIIGIIVLFVCLVVVFVNETWLLSLLIAMILLLPCFQLTTWIKYKKFRKKKKQEWDLWIEKSKKEGYYKVTYDYQSLTIFSTENPSDFLWTDLLWLFYNEEYLFFYNKKGKLELTLPKPTLGSEAFSELLTLAKTKIFYCKYLSFDPNDSEEESEW